MSNKKFRVTKKETQARIKRETAELLSIKENMISFQNELIKRKIDNKFWVIADRDDFKPLRKIVTTDGISKKYTLETLYDLENYLIDKEGLKYKSKHFAYIEIKFNENLIENLELKDISEVIKEIVITVNVIIYKINEKGKIETDLLHNWSTGIKFDVSDLLDLKFSMKNIESIVQITKDKKVVLNLDSYGVNYEARVIGYKEFLSKLKNQLSQTEEEKEDNKQKLLSIKENLTEVRNELIRRKIDDSFWVIADNNDLSPLRKIVTVNGIEKKYTLQSPKDLETYLIDKEGLKYKGKHFSNVKVWFDEDLIEKLELQNLNDIKDHTLVGIVVTTNRVNQKGQIFAMLDVWSLKVVFDVSDFLNYKLSLETIKSIIGISKDKIVITNLIGGISYKNLLSNLKKKKINK